MNGEQLQKLTEFLQGLAANLRHTWERNYSVDVALGTSPTGDHSIIDVHLTVPRNRDVRMLPRENSKEG